MPRLTKANKAARTKELNKAQGVKKDAKSYSVERDEIQFITEEKIQVLDLHHKYKIWIGAKWGGKTRPVVTRMSGKMLEDKDNYGLALKKYKTNASSRLHTAISNMGIEMRLAGFDVPLFVKGQNQTYLLKNQKYRDLNQTIEYASLDDMDGIAGIEAPNLGKFAIVHIEEPVMKGDKEQPTKEEFWETITVLESSVDRSNVRYADIHGGDVYTPDYHFTMNAWDDHPLITEAEKHFPENEFLNKCLGVEDWQKMTVEELDESWEDMKKSLQENHTAVVTFEKDSKAFIRLTMFANPGWARTPLVFNNKLPFTQEEQEEMFWNKIKDSILKKDYSLLAIYLGLKKQTDNGNKTYQTSLLETTDTVKEIKEGGWKIIGTSQGWDVDINRLFVETPIVLGERNTFTKGIEYKMFVLPQNPFKSSGSGGGRNIPIYKQKMLEITNNTTGELYALGGAKKPKLGAYLFIDDNQGTWLQYFINNVYHIKGKAKKHKPWDIISRQNWLNQAINSGFIVIDEKNEVLINEINKSVLSNGQDKRDESSTLNKLYDRINSMEYAIYPFHHWLYEAIRMG